MKYFHKGKTIYKLIEVASKGEITINTIWLFLNLVFYTCEISQKILTNRVFPKIDNSGSAARIVLEQNKFSK